MDTTPSDNPLTGPWGVAGRRYLITGTGPGMGGHSARMLTQAGATVACCDVKPEVSAALAESIGPSAVALSGDVTNEADVERAKWAEKDFERVAGAGVWVEVVEVCDGEGEREGVEFG